MAKKHLGTILGCLILVLFATGVVAGVVIYWTSSQNHLVKYTLYIGLNDQDSYEQLIGTEEAQAIVTEIILKNADGFTRLMGKGAYQDDYGAVTYENSLIYEFLYTSEEQITKIMDEVLVALNQHSILVEKQRVHGQFYSGVKP